MPSISLQFVPPDNPDLDKLRICEGATRTGLFGIIETVDDIGVYPNWINRYTSMNAVDALNHWFAIQWVDKFGAADDLSAPIKGQTQLLIAEVISRVHERDHKLSMQIANQEAEAAIEQYFGKDPYTVDPDVDIAAGKKYRILNGLTYLVLARSYLAMLISQNAIESATLSQVSFKTQQAGPQTKDIDQLIDLANQFLGLNTSLVLQLAEVVNTHPNWRQFFVDWEQLPWIVGIPHGTFGS